MPFPTHKFWLASVSTAALITAGAAQAQTTEESTVMDGEVVVEQAQPQVTVTIDDPDVDVDQAAPQVTVEQPQPEITVAVPEPNVTVEQQAPIITVEQAQPTVTVRIPEPIITIRVPRPNVDVDQADPDVAVEMPDPVVEFIRPEPRIVVEESEPNIRVEDGEAAVNVAEAEDPEIEVEQAEAEVTIEQSGEADVETTQADPVVNVEGGEAADVTVEQADAEVRLLDYETDEQGFMVDDETREAYAEGMQEHPLSDRTAGDFIGMDVLDENGNDIGEIDYVGVRGDTMVVIIGVGGFLGMGEHDVAMPLDRLTMDGDQIVMNNVSQEEIQNMPEYDQQEVRLFTDDSMTVGEMADSDQ